MQQVRYSGVAMLLHWAIAIAVIVNWRIAEYGEHLPDAQRVEVMSNHMAVGVMILVLVLLRLGWRIYSPPPPLSAHIGGWERILARTVHTLFYVLLIVMPLAGWVAMSSFGFGVNVWGLFELPALPVSQSPDRGEAIFEAHAVAGTILLALVAIHILGALKHTLIDKDGNLFRMLPFGTPKA
ncbi:MAG TPA: cytochrome b [Sphingomonadaceae bacterium]|nr:cytochrome b [Sphingomonadaceae bacterium]